MTTKFNEAEWERLADAVEELDDMSEEDKDFDKINKILQSALKSMKSNMKYNKISMDVLQTLKDFVASQESITANIVDAQKASTKDAYSSLSTTIAETNKTLTEIRGILKQSHEQHSMIRSNTATKADYSFDVFSQSLQSVLGKLDALIASLDKPESEQMPMKWKSTPVRENGQIDHIVHEVVE